MQYHIYGMVFPFDLRCESVIYIALCVCVCVRACVRARVRACVRACTPSSAVTVKKFNYLYISYIAHQLHSYIILTFTLNGCMLSI